MRSEKRNLEYCVLRSENCVQPKHIIGGLKRRISGKVKRLIGTKEMVLPLTQASRQKHKEEASYDVRRRFG